MRASKFEFEQGFWIIGIVISIGFFLYFVDRANFAAGLLNLLAPTIDLDGVRGIFFLRLIFGAGFAVYFIVVPLMGKSAAASGTKP